MFGCCCATRCQCRHTPFIPSLHVGTLLGDRLPFRKNRCFFQSYILIERVGNVLAVCLPACLLCVIGSILSAFRGGPPSPETQTKNISNVSVPTAPDHFLFDWHSEGEIEDSALIEFPESSWSGTNSVDLQVFETATSLLQRLPPKSPNQSLPTTKTSVERARQITAHEGVCLITVTFDEILILSSVQRC